MQETRVYPVLCGKTSVIIYMKDTDLYWLAGLLEGEGSFVKGPPSNPKSPIISIQTTDEDVIARVAEIFGNKYHPTTKQKSHHKQSFSLNKKGLGAVDLMKQLYPHMGIRRKQQIDEAISSCSVRPKRSLTDEQALEIRRQIQKGENYLVLAKKYGVNRSTIFNVKNLVGAYANVA